MKPSMSHAKPQSRKGTILKPIIWLALLLTLCGANRTSAQEVADTISVRTRVVFMDALVKDKKTGVPIFDLKPENFELFDDGQPRTISYFTRDGQARKPLAMVIILDCREDGAGRFLKRPEVLKAMSDVLAKLPTGDEIGIMAMNIGEDEKRVWLTSFTNDPAKIIAALERVPGFVEHPENEPNLPTDAEKQKTIETAQKSSNGSLTIGADSAKDKSAEKTESAATSKPKPEDIVETETIKGKDGAVETRTVLKDGSVNVKRVDSSGNVTQEVNGVVETETIKGKNGAVVTRTVLKDGSVNVKRVNSSGNVTLEVNDIYDMAAAVRDATRSAEKDRPNSQPAIVWVSDGIAPIFYEDRDATQQILIRSNAIFSSLTVDLRTLFKFLVPIGKPLAGWMGVSLYGSAKYLAQQSGGEAVRVNRTSDYGAGLSKIIGNLTARYSLGFALREEEKYDGRMHELAVRVKAVDAKGKTRKLEVSSRRGYFMPKSDSEQAATNK